MELNAFWASLVRRWYLAAAAVAVAAVGIVVVVGGSSATFEAEGTVLVFPPSQTTIVDGRPQTPGNPYLDLGGLTPVRDLLVRTMTATAFRLQIAKHHPAVGYEVTPDVTTNGPVLVVDVSAPTDREAIGALDDILRSVPAALADLQKGPEFTKKVPRVTSRVLTQDPVSRPDHKSQVRSAIVVGAGLLTIQLLAIGLIDGLLSRRKALTAASGSGVHASGTKRGGGPGGRETVSAQDRPAQGLRPGSRHYETQPGPQATAARRTQRLPGADNHASTQEAPARLEEHRRPPASGSQTRSRVRDARAEA